MISNLNVLNEVTLTHACVRNYITSVPNNIISFHNHNSNTPLPSILRLNPPPNPHHQTAHTKTPLLKNPRWSAQVLLYCQPFPTVCPSISLYRHHGIKLHIQYTIFTTLDPTNYRQRMPPTLPPLCHHLSLNVPYINPRTLLPETPPILLRPNGSHNTTAHTATITSTHLMLSKPDPTYDLRLSLPNLPHFLTLLSSNQPKKYA